MTRCSFFFLISLDYTQDYTQFIHIRVLFYLFMIFTVFFLEQSVLTEAISPDVFFSECCRFWMSWVNMQGYGSALGELWIWNHWLASQASPVLHMDVSKMFCHMYIYIWQIFFLTNPQQDTYDPLTLSFVCNKVFIPQPTLPACNLAFHKPNQWIIHLILKTE